MATEDEASAFADKLSDLSTLSSEDLSALEAEIVAAFDAAVGAGVPTPKWHRLRFVQMRLCTAAGQASSPLELLSSFTPLSRAYACARSRVWVWVK